MATVCRFGNESSRGYVSTEKKNGSCPGADARKRRRKKDSEEEQEQEKASQQLALTASSGCNEGTSVSSLELDLPRVRGALGGCRGAGKSGTAKDERKRVLSNSPSRLPMEEDAGDGKNEQEQGKTNQQLVTISSRQRERAWVRSRVLFFFFGTPKKFETHFINGLSRVRPRGPFREANPWLSGALTGPRHHTFIAGWAGCVQC